MKYGETHYQTQPERWPKDTRHGPHAYNGMFKSDEAPLKGATWRAPAGDGKPAEGKLPVVQIGWIDAIAYARWASLRLPTDAEWEVAASWDRAAGRRRTFPWGDEMDGSRAHMIAAFNGATPTALAPVESYETGASPAGALNMAGNACEWVVDAKDNIEVMAQFFPRLASGEVSSVDPCALPTRWNVRVVHVVRGGSFRDSTNHARAAFRGGVLGSDDVTGFRVALSLDGSPRPKELPAWDGTMTK
jgi:formylglycine-generating enzyme required for sulfatase activity